MTSVPRRLGVAAAFAVLAVSQPGHGRPPRAASADQAAQAIAAAAISAHIRFLASDLLEGRGAGTRGDRLTQAYVASQMEAAGLVPGAADGSFFQKVPLIGVTPHPPRTVRFAAGKKSLTLELTKDISINAGAPKKRSSIAHAEVVFVGYGIVAPEHGWDDYKDVDVRGKVVLVMNNDPSTDPSLFAGKTRLWYGRWDYKYLQARKQGAAGAIIIHTTPSAAYPWTVVQSSSENFELRKPGGAGGGLEATMWATEDASKRLVALGGKDLDALRAAAEKRDFRPVRLGVELSLAFDNTLKEVDTANVVGLLPGGDRRLAREVVVFTAHHDHLGIDPSLKGDQIFNGAVDNASGIAALLEIARAAALGPRPKRSLLFVAVGGEESGLLGSQWYAEHPTFPAGRISANLNMDSVNRFGRTADLGFIGYGKSSIDRHVEAVARAQGRTVHGDSNPDHGSFYRSDQFNFARIGVPALYADGGPTYVGRPAGWGKAQTDRYVDQDYHQPSDEYDGSWDLSGAVQDAQLYLLVGLRIANDRAMQTWKPGDEFEAARKAAIDALPPGS
jgi:Zn-dependent M28 family amino/carboxypeptidase